MKRYVIVIMLQLRPNTTVFQNWVGFAGANSPEEAITYAYQQLPPLPGWDIVQAAANELPKEWQR